MPVACSLCGHPHPDAPHLHVGNLGTGYVVNPVVIAAARASSGTPPTIADIAPIAIAATSAPVAVGEPGHRTHGVAKAHGGKRKSKASSGQGGLW